MGITILSGDVNEFGCSYSKETLLVLDKTCSLLLEEKGLKFRFGNQQDSEAAAFSYFCFWILVKNY